MPSPESNSPEDTLIPSAHELAFIAALSAGSKAALIRILADTRNLVAMPNDPQGGVYHRLITYGHFHLFSFFLGLEHMPPLEQLNDRGQTPVCHIACEISDDELATKLVKQLVKAGASTIITVNGANDVPLLDTSLRHAGLSR